MDKESLIDNYFGAVVKCPPPYSLPSIQDLKAGDKILIVKSEKTGDYVKDGEVYELATDPRWCGECRGCRMKGWYTHIRCENRRLNSNGEYTVEKDWCVSCNIFFASEDGKIFKETLYPERESGNERD